MFKYSAFDSIYGRESLEDKMARLAKFGYDGIDLKYNESIERSREILRSYNLKVSSICGQYSVERDFTSPDKNVRKNAIEHTKKCADIASQLACTTIIVNLTYMPKTKNIAPIEKEWEWAIEGVREAGKYALDLGVRLAIEPVNRYASYLINRVDQALEFVEKVGLDNIGIVPDCYHMNIEEANSVDAIERAGHKIIIFHVADSNRQYPGLGHINWKEILHTLKKIHYSGYLSLEAIVPIRAPYFSILSGDYDYNKLKNIYDKYTKSSIEYLKLIESFL
jgi:sugar phosphate isomerase/epimerase